MVCAPFALHFPKTLKSGAFGKGNAVTNINRNVRVLELGEAWKAHARMVPVGFTPLGTVLRAGRIHAFGRDATGEYWIFGDGRPELLPQAKLQRAIASLTTKAENPDPI